MIERIPLRMALQLHRISRAQIPNRPAAYLTSHPVASNQPRLLLQRFYSSVPPTAPQPQTSPVEPIVLNTTSGSPPPPPPPPPKPKRSLRPFIYATLFFLLGSTTGHFMRLVVSPPPLPIPDTPEDAALSKYIQTQASKLPIIQSLSSDPKFKSWDAYSIFHSTERPHRLTSGPLSGSRGLGGYQRIFHNSETGELINVLWIGGGLAGWPGVCHGGLLATVLDESLGRCAILRFPAKTGVTANLELNYLKPTMTNTFVIVRCMPVLEGSTDRKAYVEGRVETLDGKICVEAKALFIAPKNLQLRAFTPVKDGEGL